MLRGMDDHTQAVTADPVATDTLELLQRSMEKLKQAVAETHGREAVDKAWEICVAEAKQEVAERYPHLKDEHE